MNSECGESEDTAVVPSSNIVACKLGVTIRLACITNPSFTLHTEFVKVCEPPVFYLSKASSLEEIVWVVGVHCDVYCLVYRDKKPKRKHKNPDEFVLDMTDQVAHHVSGKVLLLVMCHEDQVYIVGSSAIVKHECGKPIMQFLSQVQPFLTPFHRGSLKSGRIYRMGCSMQIAMGGCVFRALSDASVQSKRFRFNNELP